MNSHALTSTEPRRRGWRTLAGWVAGLCCAAVLFGALSITNAAEPASKAKAPEAAKAGQAEADAPASHAEPPSWWKRFAFSYLTAYMFFLSLPLGALFLVILHHLLDASWSVPTRRVLEHIACLSFPWMAFLFIPIAVLAKDIFPWMGPELQAHPDHALRAKLPLFTPTMFYVVVAFCFGIWGWLSHSLRRWSLEQDKTGAAHCTFKMRSLAYWGIFAFAVTLTLAAIMWMKALQHEWFSTMYGVQYFAASVWTTLATVYLLACHFKRGPLRDVLQEKQFYFIGSLLFAFTVFYSYVTFSQYFIIWNANMPEETFFFVAREEGSWKYIGYLIIFGHFFLPFLTLLRIDFKLKIEIMFPVCVWAWLMHYFDMQFNIMPTLYPHGISLGILDLVCLVAIGTVLYKMFFKSFAAHPPYPQKDPRFAEAMDIYVEPASHASTHGGAK